MTFPKWIDSPRNSARQRASLRLKHLLQTAALNRFGRTSLRVIAKAASINHSSISIAIDRGYFTEAMAESIEKVFGRDVLPKEHLMAPLSIDTPVAA